MCTFESSQKDESRTHWADSSKAYSQPVAYLGHGRHGTCHGRHFDGGAKIAWQKLKSVTYSFLNLFSCAACNH